MFSIALFHHLFVEATVSWHFECVKVKLVPSKPRGPIGSPLLLLGKDSIVAPHRPNASVEPYGLLSDRLDLFIARLLPVMLHGKPDAFNWSSSPEFTNDLQVR